jgi:hypothetical protein
MWASRPLATPGLGRPSSLSETSPKLGGCYRARTSFGYGDGMGAFAMEDDANFTRRMRELVDDGYLVFDKFGRWSVTEKGLACLLASADRAVKTKAQERT